MTNTNNTNNPKLFASPSIWLLVIGILGLIFYPAENLYGQLKFIPNEGQWHEKVSYRAQLAHGYFYLEKGGFTYDFLDGEAIRKHHHKKSLEGSVDAHSIKVNFKNANHDPKLKRKSPYPEDYNFFTGRNPASWASGLKAFDTVVYENLYPKINLEVTSIKNRLKYNIKVEPEGKAENISLTYKGANEITLDDGQLKIKTSVNEFREMAPVAYQLIEGERKEIPCEFRLNDSTIQFNFPEGYDQEYPLIIDPEVIFSTFSGSQIDNFGYSATYDTLGNAYSAGTVFGSNFPVTSGAYQVNWAGGAAVSWGASGGARDIGILKYNDSGTNVKYVTYLGGSHNEDPHSMVVNSEQDLLVFGNTGSKNFPMAGQPYQDSLRGNYDIFLVKLSEDGSNLKSSTFLGGSGMDGLNGRQVSRGNNSDLGFNYGDMFRGEVIVDSNDNVLIATTTKSNDFPVTNNAFQSQYGGGDQDACVARLDDSLSQLDYASYWGGSSDDAAYSLTVSPDGDILFSGGTMSNNFSSPISGYQKQNKGGPVDGYIIRFSPNSPAIQASTLLGTSSYDQTYFVKTDSFGHVFVTGQTKSNSFPYKKANYYDPGGKQFVSKFSPDLNTLMLSTTFGSGARKAPDLSPSAFLVDECGRIFFSGWGGNTNFQGNTSGLEVTKNAFDSTTDNSDFYLAVFAQNMDTLLYGTYYGGQQSEEHVDGGTSRFDENSIIYQSVCAGCGGFSDLPTTPANVWSDTNRGTRPDGRPGCNNALLKIDLDVEFLSAQMKFPEASCIKTPVTFIDNSTSAKSLVWDLGDGDTVQTKDSFTHQYDTTGKYEVTLIASNPLSCKFKDTVKDSIAIYKDAGADMGIDTGECSNIRKFTYEGLYGESFKWHFGDSSKPDTVKNPDHVYSDTGLYEVRCIVDGGTPCADTAIDTVYINRVTRPDFSFSIDTCKGAVTFSNKSRNTNNYLWQFGDGNDTFLTSKDKVTHLYPRSDTFLPKLYTDTGKLCKDSIRKLFILKSPDGSIEYNIIDSCDFKVEFIDKSAFADSLVWILEGDTIKGQMDTVFNQFPGPGSYPVRLKVKGPRGICSDTLSETIQLDSLPEAGFNFNTNTCSSFIELNDSANKKQLKWRVTDTNGGYDSVYQSSKKDSVFIPAPRNNYRVRQIAQPNSHCADTMDQIVNLDSAAYASFDYNLDTCERMVTFNNFSTKLVTQTWDFDDGNQSSKYEPVHKFNVAGTYDVKLTINDKGCRDTQVESISIPSLPEANFSFSSTQCSNSVAFTNNSRFADEVVWDFDDSTVIDGSKDTLNVDSLVHDYSDTGIYRVSLVAKNQYDCKDTSFKMVKLDSFANAEFQALMPDCSGDVIFRNETDSIGTYAWEFGDGESSKEYSPMHNYDVNDSFEVRLIHKMSGCRDTAFDSVSSLVPEAEFNYERLSCSPTVEFDNVSESNDNSLWYFGDGDSSLQFEPTKVYEETGTFQVKLIVSQNRGCSDTFVKSVDIPSFIRGRYQFKPSDCKPGGIFELDTVRTDSLAWRGLVDTFATTQEDSFYYNFGQPGNYKVSLIVYNENCQDTFSNTLAVDSGVDANFTVNNNPCFAWIEVEEASVGAKSHKWSFGDGGKSTKPDPTHFYRSNGEYTVNYFINKDSRCKDSARKKVLINGVSSREFEVPNTFTPNGDGINDYFKSEGITGCDYYTIDIYNRWGQLVFQKEGDGAFKWDGRNYKTGKPVSEGTYYYSIRAGEFEQSGTIKLIRSR